MHTCTHTLSSVTAVIPFTFDKESKVTIPDGMEMYTVIPVARLESSTAQRYP